jgi:hypothetical protein
MVRSGIAVTVMACAALAGCSDTTAVRHGSLLVTVASPSAIATQSASADTVKGRSPVEVTLENASSYTVRVYSCVATLEHETPTGWSTAAEPFCSLTAPGYRELPPSSRQTVRESIMASLSGNAGLGMVGGVLAGRYRLLYRYAAVGNEGPLDEARSAPFFIVTE